MVFYADKIRKKEDCTDDCNSWQIWLPDMAARYGCQIWLPDMAARYGCQIYVNKEYNQYYLCYPHSVIIPDQVMDDIKNAGFSIDRFVIIPPDSGFRGTILPVFVYGSTS
jgi:hypothetical protein